MNKPASLMSEDQDGATLPGPTSLGRAPAAGLSETDFDDPEIEGALDALTCHRPEPERPLGEQAGQWIGRYQLTKLIDVGGMGEVWSAGQHAPVKRRVALKIVKLGMDTKEVVRRFDTERRALAMMNHPHIAQMFDAGATAAG